MQRPVSIYNGTLSGVSRNLIYLLQILTLYLLAEAPAHLKASEHPPKRPMSVAESASIDLPTKRFKHELWHHFINGLS